MLPPPSAVTVSSVACGYRPRPISAPPRCRIVFRREPGRVVVGPDADPRLVGRQVVDAVRASPAPCPGRGSMKSYTFTSSGSPCEPPTPGRRCGTRPTSSFFFASTDTAGWPLARASATRAATWRNWASRSGWVPPSLVLRLRLQNCTRPRRSSDGDGHVPHPAFAAAAAALVQLRRQLAGAPCTSTAGATCGSPRAVGSTSDSRSRRSVGSASGQRPTAPTGPPDMAGRDRVGHAGRPVPHLLNADGDRRPEQAGGRRHGHDPAAAQRRRLGPRPLPPDPLVHHRPERGELVPHDCHNLLVAHGTSTTRQASTINLLVHGSEQGCPDGPAGRPASTGNAGPAGRRTAALAGRELRMGTLRGVLPTPCDPPGEGDPLRPLREPR